MPRRCGRKMPSSSAVTKNLDDFAYIASHDLKEPLRGINNYCSFIIEDHEEKLDEDAKAKLKTVMRLAQRLEKSHRLFDDILTCWSV